MNKYIVHIKETLARSVEIKAESIEDAIEKANKKWLNCEIILNADDFSEAEIQAESKDGREATGWRILW